MNRLLRLAYIISILAVSLSLQASSRPVSRRLAEEIGLSSNFVKSIAQDKRGVIWVATEYGVNTFDGNRFIPVYKNSADSLSGLSGNELNTLLDDPTDSIMWIGTQRAGLNAFNYSTGEIRQFTHKDGDSSSLVTDDITKLTATPDGKIIVATYWRGFDILDPKTGTFSHFNANTVLGMSSCCVWTVADAGNDDLVYVGHENGGLTIVSTKNKSASRLTHNPADPSSIPSNTVNAILPLNSKEVLVGTTRGLALFDTETEKFRPFSSGIASRSNIFDIKKMSDGRIAVSTEFNGVVIIDSPVDPDKPELPATDLVNKSLFSWTATPFSSKSIFQDNHNNLWVGSYGQGVYFVTDKRDIFSPLEEDVNGVPRSACTPNQMIKSLVEDKEGKLWVATDGNGLKVYKDDMLAATHENILGARENNHICAAFRDRKGNLWFGVYDGGIIHYDYPSGTFRMISDSDIDVRSFYESGNDVYALSTKGIFRINPDSGAIEETINVKSGRKMLKDNKGRYWVGTFGDGIRVFDKDWKEIANFIVRTGMPSNTVNDMIIDSGNRIWVATGEGLVVFPNVNGFDYKVINSEDGQPIGIVNCLIEDKERNIWIGGKRGISIITPDAQNTGSEKLITLSPLSGRAVTMARDGSLYFGTDNGICHFSPEEALKESIGPKPVISAFLAFGSDGKEKDFTVMGQAASSREYTLPHDINTLFFAAGIEDYALSDRVEYSFILEGFDKEWFSNGSNSVEYRNLPPGKYTFKVRTRIHNQKWSDESTSLQVVINPPIWLTWWAKTLYFLIAAAIIVLLLYVYRRRLKAESLYMIEKKNRIQTQELTDERLRFYTNITHELRTPLTLIVGPLEDAMRDSDISGKNRNRLSIIHKNAKDLLALVNQILDFRKSETKNKRLFLRTRNIVSTVYETALKYKELLDNQKIHILISAPEEDITMLYDKEVVGTILDNLISNAIKYTEKGSIAISCKRVEDNGEDFVEISVADTGYGIGEEALPHIFDRYYQEKGTHQASGTGIGLSLVKNLVDLHHGTITVKSRLNQGTTFTVRLHIGEKYPEAINQDPEPIEVSDSGEPVNDSKQRPMVLVVEDNSDLRQYVSDSFVDLYDVKTAANGKEGLEMARRLVPDVIITDLMMPVMDGIEMCKALKGDIATCHIPIVVLTAKDSEADREEGYLVGASSYLIKPFSSQLLISRVNNLLMERQRLAERNLPVAAVEEKKGSVAEEPRESEPQKSLSPLDKDFLEKLNNTINDHMSTETVDIPFLADELCVSKATLYRKVKALTGVSPNEYIRKMRMQTAEKLLKERKLTISEISFRVGINSSSYFRQCFKEEFGMTPTEYQQTL